LQRHERDDLIDLPRAALICGRRGLDVAGARGLDVRNAAHESAIEKALGIQSRDATRAETIVVSTTSDE